MNGITNNISALQHVLDVFRKNMETREYVNTPYGMAKAAAGYEICSIYKFRLGYRIEAYFFDRQLREKDDYARDGDKAILMMIGENVYDFEEYEALCAKEEKEDDGGHEEPDL